MPRPKRQLNPLIRRYLNASRPAGAGAKGADAQRAGAQRADAQRADELKPVEPAARRDGAPLLGHDQVYVMKYGTDYHTAWCRVVADKWDHAPRGLLVTLVADVGERTRCTECDRPLMVATVPSSPDQHLQPMPGQETPAQVPPVPDRQPGMVIPLKVVGVAHGILFLAAGPEHQKRLKETAVEPATPLLVDGLRDGMVVRLDASREEPLLLVQLDSRATFRDGPYQVRLRRPLRRSATKPYAVEYVEPVP